MYSRFKIELKIIYNINIYKILNAFKKNETKVGVILKKYISLAQNESTADNFSEEESKYMSAFINKALKELSAIDEGKVNESLDNVDADEYARQIIEKEFMIQRSQMSVDDSDTALQTIFDNMAKDKGLDSGQMDMLIDNMKMLLEDLLEKTNKLKSPQGQIPIEEA